MKKITIKEIIQATGAQMLAAGDAEEALQKEIWYVTQDSRETKAGVLFVARIGAMRDGHDFLPQCFANGVTACLSQKAVAPTNGAVVLLVPDTAQALLDLAAYYRSLFDLPVVAVTGSVGKTTTKEMIAAVVSQKYDTLFTEGNLNNEVGVPLTLFRIEEHHQAAIIEMGMNHFGELDRIARAVRPNIGVISNIGVAHIEFLGSRTGILQAKCEMLAHLERDGVAILNGDDDMLQTLAGKLPQRILWFGLERKMDFYADEMEQLGLEKTACTIHTPIGSVRVHVPVPGAHMVRNVLSAAAVGVELGLSLEQIKAGIEGFRASKNRMSIETTRGGITVLNDVYNSNPVSCQAALDILANAAGRKIAVLGFMGELGDYAEEGHRAVGTHAAKQGIDVLYCIGAYGDAMADAAKKAGMKEVYFLETQEEFWEKGLPLFRAGDTVLVKASRSGAFEKTVAKLQGVN